MEKWILLIVLATAFVFGMSDANSNFANEDRGQFDLNVANGKEAYVNNCAACHGGDLTGASGPELTKVGAYYSAEEIEHIIENGMGEMLAQPQISDVERAAIAEWLIDQ